MGVQLIKVHPAELASRNKARIFCSCCALLTQMRVIMLHRNAGSYKWKV